MTAPSSAIRTPEEHHGSIVERWENADDALVVQPADAVEPWPYRYAVRAALWALLLFPLFFGGKNDMAVFLMQTAIFALAAAIALAAIFSPAVFSPRPALSRALKGALVLAICFAAVLLLQIVPLPLHLLARISPVAAEVYQRAGAASGAISLEPALTASGLGWCCAIMLAAFWLCALPIRRTRLSVSGSRRVRLRDPVTPRARDLDAAAELLQRGVIGAGVICSIIAITHWAMRTELLFGLFEARLGPVLSLRAHWPFVNPDHLSVVLLVSVMTCLCRLLVLAQLQALRSPRERTDNLSLLILDSPARLGLQIPYMLALLAMVLCNVLTLSRVGNALMVCGVVLLIAVYQRYPVRPAPAGAPLSERTKGLSRRARSLVRRALFFGSALFIVLFFLGQTGRDLAANRIEYGLAAGYDEGRRLLAETGWKLFRDYPVLGSGLGTWGGAAERYMPHKLAGWTLDYAHNDYLQLLGEAGAAGGALALALVVLLAGAGVRTWRRGLLPTERVLLAGSGCAAALPLIHAGFDFPLHVPGAAFVVVLAAVIYLRICLYIEPAAQGSESAAVRIGDGPRQ